MKTVLNTADKITEEILLDITKGNTDSYGDRVSDYHILVEDENERRVLIQVTEEKSGLSSDAYFYSIHMIDEITGGACELYSTDDLKEENLLTLISELIKNNM